MQIKGTKSGLLIHLYERPLAGSIGELRSKLESLPGFYRGGRAVLMLGALPAETTELAAVVATLEQYGITADGAACDSDAVAGLARSAGLRLVAASVAASPRSRDDRVPKREHRDVVQDGLQAFAPSNEPVTASSDGGLRFHKGTVRSGQLVSAHGTIVVVGDVNAGGELLATGDIVVWGALRGVAHAGAEGNESASVRALRLEATQLRIARCIAVAPAGDKQRKKRPLPEIAHIRNGRIVIEPVN